MSVFIYVKLASVRLNLACVVASFASVPVTFGVCVAKLKLVRNTFGLIAALAFVEVSFIGVCGGERVSRCRSLVTALALKPMLVLVVLSGEDVLFNAC